MESSVIKLYFTDYTKHSYRSFLDINYDKIITYSILSDDWLEIDKSWSDRFLREAKQLLDENSYIALKDKVDTERSKKGFKKYWENVIEKQKAISVKENIPPPLICSNCNKVITAELDIIKFWKELPNAKIAFPLPEDIEESDLEGLKHFSIIENNEIYFEQGIVCDLDGRLYINGESSNMQLPSKLMENFGGMLCLPDNIFFLGNEVYGSKLLIRRCYLQLLNIIIESRQKGGPAKSGCAITGTPGTGKLYFGFYLLFYLYYKYPNATIVWYCNENICYQFMPDGNVLEGDIYQFGIALRNRDNFLLMDAADLKFQYKAYKVLFTLPKAESPNDPCNWPGFTKFYMPIWDQEEITTLWALQYKNARNYKNEEFTFDLLETLLEKWGPIPRSVLSKWDDDTYQKEYQQLINEANFDNCVNSIDKSGMPTGSISGRLVHIHTDPTFTSAIYRFASLLVFNKLVEEYETKTRRSARDLI
ncbi:18857_t:CDS:2, partial [Gigaspora margarita]